MLSPSPDRLPLSLPLAPKTAPSPIRLEDREPSPHPRPAGRPDLAMTCQCPRRNRARDHLCLWSEAAPNPLTDKRSNADPRPSTTRPLPATTGALAPPWQTAHRSFPAEDPSRPCSNARCSFPEGIHCCGRDRHCRNRISWPARAAVPLLADLETCLDRPPPETLRGSKCRMPDGCRGPPDLFPGTAPPARRAERGESRARYRPAQLRVRPISGMSHRDFWRTQNLQPG